MPEADAALRIVVEAFETALPLRVRAYYVAGSVADRSNVSTSDLDLTVVFAGARSEADQVVAANVVERCQRMVGIELDVDCTDEASLVTGLPPQLKLGGILVAALPGACFRAYAMRWSTRRGRPPSSRSRSAAAPAAQTVRTMVQDVKLNVSISRPLVRRINNGGVQAIEIEPNLRLEPRIARRSHHDPAP